ncbi:protein PAT1 homolog 1-like isoform X3 [Ruditapes philippinarum]|uniref:protein PAT1 homolog 1-like isoform X3 n=1 Tax=Ruditapes philippinarum TaxID=129788 RepID=UPI00295AEC90|nr:protein PAT1 homolog 1-like isoform X3 [Ruditapes philippinarum]
MADACFADYSTLGKSDVKSYDNELLEAPEEEGEFDVLNDETFGNLDDDDFDWEEQTEKFAEVYDPEHASHQHNDSGFNTAEKSYRTQEEYMEHSINQLMVDDDDSDPAILKSKPIPKWAFIPQRQQNLDSLFGPASPPSFLDAEHLVSPTSKNIWGSPLQEIQQPPQHVNNIQSLFDFAKSANSDAPVASIHGPHSRSAPMVLPKAQTLEEIENSLLRKPKVLTAEELERQLRGESPSHPSSLPNGHPIPPAQFNIPPPNMASSLPRQHPASMVHGPPPGMKGVSNGHRSPVFGTPGPIGTPVRVAALPGTPVNTTPHQYRNRQSPVLMLTRRSPVPRSPTPPPLCVSPIPRTPQMIGVPFRFMTPYASPSQPRYIATPGRGLSQPIGIPHAMRGPPPTNSPQGLYGSPQGPYSSPHQQRFQQPGSFNEVYNNNRNNNNAYQSSPHMKAQYQERQRNDQANNKEHRYHRYPYNQKYESRQEHSGQRKRGSKDEDNYAGLMTQKEKEWIIKIQLLQLQTDNPYEDDYYYASWCLRKKAKELEKDVKEDSERNLIIPLLARAENRVYKPAHFEGSLGRLTTSSVHNPRQIIDLLAKSVSETAAGVKNSTSNVGKELRKSRQLFMDIEKGYNLLLDIDTLEKQILALPEDMRKPLLEERSIRVDLLFHYLLCDGNSAAFMQYMNVRKGRSLTRRALPYLDKVQSVGIVSLVCKNLQQLMKNDQADERLEELFLPCAKVIESCNLATVVMFVEDIQHEESPSTTKPIAMALQNKFGSSMLCVLLHQGEHIYSTTSPVDLDSNLQNEWGEFVHDFAGIMATLPLESIVAPIQTHSDISPHLERLLNKRLMAVVEDNLKIFTHPPVVNES